MNDLQQSTEVRELDYMRLIPESHLIQKNPLKGILFAFLGIIICIAGYFIGQIPFSAVAYIRASALGDPIEIIQEMNVTKDFSVLGLDNNLGFLLMLMSFVGMMIAMLIYLRFAYKLPILKMFTPFARFRWGRARWGFFLMLGITVILEGTGMVLYSENFTLQWDPAQWLPLLLISLTILPIQTTAEELVIRGYLMPHVSHLLNGAWAGLLATSLLFALLHMGNPEVVEYGIQYMFPYYLISALFLGLMTIWDNGLEMAMGVHWAVNIFSATIITYEGAAIQTPTIWIMEETDVGTMLVVTTVTMIGFLWLSAKKYQWKGFHLLTQNLYKYPYELQINESNSNDEIHT